MRTAIEEHALLSGAGDEAAAGRGRGDEELGGGAVQSWEL